MLYWCQVASSLAITLYFIILIKKQMKGDK